MSNSSGFIPIGSSQSKRYRRFANANSRVANAKDMPGQLLRPAPNEISSKSFPLKCTSLLSSMNRSGLNSSASFQYFGSLPTKTQHTRQKSVFSNCESLILLSSDFLLISGIENISPTNYQWPICLQAHLPLLECHSRRFYMSLGIPVV